MVTFEDPTYYHNYLDERTFFRGVQWFFGARPIAQKDFLLGIAEARLPKSSLDLHWLFALYGLDGYWLDGEFHPVPEADALEFPQGSVECGAGRELIFRFSDSLKNSILLSRLVRRWIGLSFGKSVTCKIVAGAVHINYDHDLEQWELWCVKDLSRRFLLVNEDPRIQPAPIIWPYPDETGQD